jgi:hypothetical protein
MSTIPGARCGEYNAMTRDAPLRRRPVSSSLRFVFAPVVSQQGQNVVAYFGAHTARSIVTALRPPHLSVL